MSDCVGDFYKEDASMLSVAIDIYSIDCTMINTMSSNRSSQRSISGLLAPASYQIRSRPVQVSHQVHNEK